MRICIKYSKRLPGKWQHVNDMTFCVYFSVCIIRTRKTHTQFAFFAHSQATYELSFRRQMIPICVNVIISTAEENIWKRMTTADDEFSFR